MNKPSVYILIYNDRVQYASKDIKSLHGAIEVMCSTLNVPLPASYVHVTRLINEKSFYIHTPAFGHQWQVIERELMYTRRRKRQSIQNTINPLNISNVNSVASTITTHNPNTL